METLRLGNVKEEVSIFAGLAGALNRRRHSFGLASKRPRLPRGFSKKERPRREAAFTARRGKRSGRKRGGLSGAAASKIVQST